MMELFLFLLAFQLIVLYRTLTTILSFYVLLTEKSKKTTNSIKSNTPNKTYEERPGVFKPLSNRKFRRDLYGLIVNNDVELIKRYDDIIKHKGKELTGKHPNSNNKES